MWKHRATAVYLPRTNRSRDRSRATGHPTGHRAHATGHRAHAIGHPSAKPDTEAEADASGQGERREGGKGVGEWNAGCLGAIGVD